MYNTVQKLWYLGIAALFAVVVIAPPALSQYDASVLSASSPMNLLSNGGFEVMKPAYWDPSGDGAAWTDTRSRTPERSLELAGAGESSWTMSEGVRNWTPGFPGGGNPELEIGGWVYLDGVNTSPSSDDERFQLVFEFFTDATQTTNVLGEPIVLDLPQDQPSTFAWVELSSATLGAITFPGEQAAKSARVTFRKGANATGSAYLDDLFIRAVSGAEGWSGDFFNANFDAGDTWYYWWNNFSGGEAVWPDEQPHVVSVSGTDAYEGDYSLRLEANTDNQLETVGVSQRVPIDGPVVVSFRVRHEGNAEEDSIGTGGNNLGVTVLWYSSLESGAAGYNQISEVNVTLNSTVNDDATNEQVVPKLSSSEDGWTQYAFVLYPADGTVGTEIRPRYWNGFSGVTYWDDFFVAPLSEIVSSLADENELSNGGFEVMKPAYWDADGDGATWSDAMARTPEWSLALSGAGEATWIMSEGVRNWTPGFPGGGNPEIEIGGWVYTDGVNTDPASDDEKFQLVFEFFEDATQTTNVLGEPVVLDLPQGAASSGEWVELSSATLGAITFPGEQAAKSARVTFRKGANATGTAYLDDLYIRTAEGSDGWSGDFFNANMDAGDKNYYWWNNFSGGVADWPDTQDHINTVSNGDAYEGDFSLRLEANVDNENETVGILERVPAMPGVPMLISYFVKHEGNTAEDSIGVGQNNLGMVFLSYSSLESGAAGYNQIGEVNVTLNSTVNDDPVNEQFVPKLGTSVAGKSAGADWTQYGFVYYPLADAAGIEVRPRYFNGFTGVSYWDNVSVIPLGGLHVNTAVEDDLVDGSLPESFRLLQNYPNPFNPATTIAFDLKKSETVSLGVFNVLGQKVATLLDGQVMAAGTQTVDFNAGSLPSGLYLYVLEVDNRAVSKKMVLLK